VRERAGERCEYCLIAESQAFGPHEPDHLIALNHGGETSSANLALACFECNRFKGTNIASLDPLTGELVELFNPRKQMWSEHFHLDGWQIIPLTAIGRATERLLRMNAANRLQLREQSVTLGTYL
jgi:hypothetical protein